MSSINVQSLGYVVKSALADLGLPESAYYEQFLHWAIKAYREINNIGLMPTVKTVSIPINQSTLSAPLPSNYVDFVRIGVCCNGIFINFDYNDEICLFGDNLPASCCDTSQIANNISAICNAVNSAGCGNNPNGQSCCDSGGYGFGYWGWAGWTNGAWNYSLPNFGIGLGTYKGGYRINKQLGIIQFDSCVKAQSFTMEYISSGFDDMGNAIIPEGLIPAINEYIHWQRCRFMRGDSPNDRRLLRQEASEFKRRYLVLVDDFNHRENALTKYEYLNINRRFSFQQVKG